MLVIATKKEIVETAETPKIIETPSAGENGKDGKDNKYPRNLARVLWI